MEEFWAWILDLCGLTIQVSLGVLEVIDLVLGSVDLPFESVPVVIGFLPLFPDVGILVGSSLIGLFSLGSNSEFVVSSSLLGSLVKHIVDIPLHLVEGIFDGPKDLLGFLEFS